MENAIKTLLWIFLFLNMAAGSINFFAAGESVLAEDRNRTLTVACANMGTALAIIITLFYLSIK